MQEEGVRCKEGKERERGLMQEEKRNRDSSETGMKREMAIEARRDGRKKRLLELKQRTEKERERNNKGHLN